MIVFLLPIVVPIAVYLLVTIVVGMVAMHHNDRQGFTVEKRVREKRRTFNDGLGKYTVNIREEEWVRVPKDQNK